MAEKSVGRKMVDAGHKDQRSESLPVASRKFLKAAYPSIIISPSGRFPIATPPLLTRNAGWGIEWQSW
jgi:hypothetical protein